MPDHCPSQSELSAYAAGTLSEGVADRLIAHLAGCSQCDATMTESAECPDTLQAVLTCPDESDPLLDEPQLQDALIRIAAIGRTVDGDRAADTHQEQREPAATLGGYELLRTLGQGGMGIVYEALHRKLGKKVALKMVSADRLADTAAIRRFQREMRAVGQLDHPNIVAAHDAGEADGRHFLVMELIAGPTLSTLLRRLGPARRTDSQTLGDGAMSVADICEMIRQAAIGLEYARQRGLVHRDIKPSNLILGVPAAAGHPATPQRPPLVKILDFGLALLADPLPIERCELTASGLVMGTLDYMAPEQMDNCHQVDIRSDIYSLGATLYRLLAGTPPYSGWGANNSWKRDATEMARGVQSIGELRDDLPAELVELVDRMLATRPEDRPATPAEVAEALTPLARGADLAELWNRFSSGAARPSPEMRAASPQPTMEATPQSAPSRRLNSHATRRWLLGLAAAGFALLTGVYRIATDHGELVIVANEPGLEVVVKRNGQAVDQFEVHHERTRTTIRSGDISVELRGAKADALVATSDKTGGSRFILTRGDQVVVQVTRQVVEPMRRGTDPPPPANPVSAREGDRQRQVARWVQSAGGRLGILDSGRQREIGPADPLPQNPFEITGVTVGRNGGVLDSDLARLVELPKLQLLDLSHAPIGDNAAVHLARLTSLKHLYLLGTAVSSAGLRHLTHLTEMEDLDLEATRIDDAGLIHLAALTRLTRLALSGTHVSDGGLAHLRGLQQLSELKLNATAVSNAGLAELASLRQLHLVFLDGTRVSDAGVQQMRSWHQLRTLSLSGTSVTDEALIHLAALHGLTDLYLSNTQIGDAGLQHLASKSQLMTLGLSGTQVSDKGITSLATLPRLQVVDLTSTRVSPTGQRELLALRPELQVTR